MIPTTLAPFLSVRNGAKAVEFYKSAFGAEEIFRHEDPTGRAKRFQRRSNSGV